MNHDQVLLTLEHLGGYYKLKAMINARNLSYSEHGLTFRFSGNKEMNVCKIQLLNDEYRLTFFKLANSELSLPIKKDIPALNSNIKEVFEDQTGLKLSL